ncbi:MAG: hypothetical protein ABI977_00225 [Acidobacteriota bacterium]
MEQKIEFIIKQQESFGDSQVEIYKMLHELAERQDRTQVQVEKTQAQVEKTQAQVEKTNEAVFGLVHIVGSLAQSQKATNDQVAELSGRLDVFINVLERYISEDRNGSHSKDS